MLTIFLRKKREGVNSIESVFEALEDSLCKHNKLQLPCSGASPKSLIKNIYFAFRHKGEINHITGDAHYIALGTGRNTLLTIHDVGSALSGNKIEQLYIRLFWFILPIFIVKKIVVISESTKKELLKIIPWANNKISVIHDPINSAYLKSNRHEFAPIPRILHIGTKMNKNLERTIMALSEIKCKLIIIGKLTEIQSELLKNSDLKFENYYDISLSDLINEYHKCDIVSFPSYYEGFGMPIIEAQASERPVLAGNIEVLRDIAGREGALYIDPYNMAAIREGFKVLINDKEMREKLILNGKENVKRFMPETIAKLYNQQYEDL